MRAVVTAALLVGMTFALPQQPRAPTCGYESCPKAQPGKLNVHLVPHTHDDVGWLKTVDQYYYGSKNNIQNAGVQYILDSVVNVLLRDPAKKFIYVETAFFWKWWVEQTPELQEKVKGLVNNGQLEFIGGAWVMNDEATTHYQPTIDQFTYGLGKLNETFGTCGQPKVGWQIDPFGHSREQASLMTQYGFDGLFFARLDYQDKDKRVKTKTMETVWETNPDLGDSSDILTHVLNSHYSTPGGFCWDDYCGDEPIIDNPAIPDYNVPDRVNAFIDSMKAQSQRYRSNNILVVFGDDFQYKSAHKNYKNIDKLIRYVNEKQSEGSDVNVFYSTPSCYLKSLNEAQESWPTKQDDFFPYASDPNSYWTGYFTSRSTLKYFERQSNNLLQAGKQLASVTKVDSGNLEPLQDAMGVLQHHDAIAGTEKQAVAEDYARLLHKAVVQTEQVVFSALNTLLGNGNNVPPLALDSCRLRNISQCALTAEKESFLVTIYNPLSRSVDYFVRLPIQDATYTVQDPEGSEILTQTLPVPDQLTTLPGRDAQTRQELVFTASKLPPLGYRSYLVTRDTEKRASATSHIWKPKHNEEVVIGDKETRITLDSRTKFLKSISTKAETYGVAQSLQYYIGEDNGRASGAYVFRPTTTEPMQITDEVDTQVIQGDVVHEVHQVFSDWASQIIRHYNNQPVVEFEWLVGPIPIDDNKGREVISKFTTTIPTDDTFFTDANGRQVLKRKRNYRPTWDLEVNEPVAGNYYPVVTHISFDNSSAGLAIVTDRAQGGSSMVDGSLEVMVHRRLLHDDGFGAGEALNEQQYGKGLVARGRHFVLIGPTNSTVSPREIRLLETRKVLDGLVFLSDATGKTVQNIQSNYRLEYSALTKALPEQVQVLTLEPRKDGTLLLRLEHIFSRKEDSTTVSVDLTNLLADYEITDARETNLAANKWIEETTRLTWQKETNEIPKYSPKSKAPLALNAVELEPRQIRTFVVSIKAR